MATTASASPLLRASVTALTADPASAGDAVTVLVDGADTAVTANGLTDYTPAVGDRLLVTKVGGQLEVAQFLSRAILPASGAELSALQTQIDTLNDTTLPALQADLETLNDTTIPALNTALTTAQGDIDTLNDTTIPGLNTSITALQGKFPVEAPDIAAGAVTTNALDAEAVTAEKIAANTITAAQIAAHTITATEIEANTITATELAAGAVDTDALAAEAVTADKIAANTITADQIAADTITANELDLTTLNGETIIGTIIETATSGRRAVLGTDAFNIPDASNIAFFNDATTVYPGVVGPYTSGSNSALAVTSPTTSSEGQVQLDLISGPSGGLGSFSVQNANVFFHGGLVEVVDGTLNLPGQDAIGMFGTAGGTVPNATFTTVPDWTASFPARGGLTHVGATITVAHGGPYMCCAMASANGWTPTGGRFIGRFLVNGTTAYAQTETKIGSNTVDTVVCIAMLNLNVGDTIAFQVYQNTGATQTLYVNSVANQSFSVWRLG